MDEVRTTTEIDTELKVEIKLQTESIIKVQRRGPKGGPISKDVANIQQESKADGMVNGKAEEKVKTSTSDSKMTEKTREEIKAEREAKKMAKQLSKKSKTTTAQNTTEMGGTTATIPPSKTQNPTTNNISASTSSTEVIEKKKTPLTKAERRAMQEAQRAAKAAAKTQQEKETNKSTKDISKKAASVKESPSVHTTQSQKETTGGSPSSSPRNNTERSLILQTESNIKLFNHLERSKADVNLFVNNIHIHPCVARLGEQYARRTVVGSNARVIGFLNAIKMLIKDYETPPKKDFCRSLETSINYCVDYLQQCRPLAVSVNNAQKILKQVLMHLSNDRPETELKEKLCNFIDTYMENQIEKAAQAINSMMQKKINDGDVLLTFGCSSLINYILEEAHNRQVDFRVIVVDARPFSEGEELLRRLATKGIRCSYVLINAVSFVMPEVTKVLLGAHALLANGYVMSRAGTAQVALVAHSFNVPVLVCCETHKFSERFQTDAIVYNELGTFEESVVGKSKMTPLILNYDVTPPELVTAVVTEVSVLPCTSVPVILRMKPDWITYAH